MTQQIREQIRTLQWEYTGIDGYERWRHRQTGEISYAGEPPLLPDTIDAAVAAIEGAGYIVLETYYDCEDDEYTVIAWKPHTDIKVRAAANGDSTAATYALAHWQLALACAKQSRPTREEGK